MPNADERDAPGAAALLDAAAGSAVRVCFEPEPGMLVDSLERTTEFFERLGRDDLWLMLDVGHVPVTEGELDWSAVCAALAALPGDPLCSLELPRHAHDPVTTARDALAFLRARGA